MQSPPCNRLASSSFAWVKSLHQLHAQLFWMMYLSSAIKDTFLALRLVGSMVKKHSTTRTVSKLFLKARRRKQRRPVHRLEDPSCKCFQTEPSHKVYGQMHACELPSTRSFHFHMFLSSSGAEVAWIMHLVFLQSQDKFGRGSTEADTVFAVSTRLVA